MRQAQSMTPTKPSAAIKTEPVRSSKNTAVTDVAIGRLMNTARAFGGAHFRTLKIGGETFVCAVFSPDGWDKPNVEN